MKPSEIGILTDDAKAAPTALFEIDENCVPPRKWKLLLQGDSLCFEPPQGTPQVILRAEVAEKINLMDRALFVRRLLIAKLRKQVIFRLDPDTFDAITEWIGPPTEEDLKKALRKYLFGSLPLGVLFVITSIPLFGIVSLLWIHGVATDGKADAYPVLLGLIDLALGILILVIGILNWLAPHRILFALNAIWFMAMAATTVINVIVAGRSWWWLLLVVVGAFAVIGSIKEYQRFAPQHMAPKNEVTQ